VNKSIHFQTVDLTKFLTCSAGLNMGTVSGTTHIKTIFSFSPGTEKHFTGNALCSSDDSVTQLIHNLHFFTLNSVLYKTLQNKRKSRSQIWRTRWTELSCLMPLACTQKMTMTKRKSWDRYHT